VLFVSHYLIKSQPVFFSILFETPPLFVLERRGASAILRVEIERKIHYFKAQSVLQMQLLFRGILHWYRPPIETPDPAVRT